MTADEIEYALSKQVPCIEREAVFATDYGMLRLDGADATELAGLVRSQLSRRLRHAQASQADITMERIHAIASALAGMTKGQPDIQGVAAQYLNGALVPPHSTPAEHLMCLLNEITEFLEAMADQVWTRQDFINSGQNPDEFDDYRRQ